MTPLILRRHLWLWGAMPQPKHFVAGDLRANEQPILTSLHTLFCERAQ